MITKISVFCIIILSTIEVFAGSVSYKMINKNYVEYTIFFDTKIEMPHNYRDVYLVLKYARKIDRVNIIINTPGGYLHTCIALYDLIKACKAKTNAVIYMAYSGGSIIAMACDTIYVADFSSMMIHMPACRMSGNVVSTNISALRMINKATKMYKKIFKKFLTNKEFNFVFKGKDLYIGADVMRIKLRKMNRLHK